MEWKRFVVLCPSNYPDKGREKFWMDNERKKGETKVGRVLKEGIIKY